MKMKRKKCSALNLEVKNNVSECKQKRKPGWND